MKSSPRQLRSHLAAALCGVCLALVPTSSTARQGRPAARSPQQRPPAKESKQKSSRQSDAKAKAKRERGQAVAALVEVADAARALEDPEARAEILSLAADALWTADEPGARNVFRRAWESATAADLADTKRREEEFRARRPDVLAPKVAEATRARFAVLGMLARRDARAAEALLAELKPATAFDEGDGEGSDAGRAAAATNEQASAVRENGRELSPRGAQRLELALDILYRGDPARAAQLAAPLVAEGPTRGLIRFLVNLRPWAPAEADGLYSRLLARTASDRSADANDVLILSSYVVSPHVIFTISDEASVQLDMVWPLNGEVSDVRRVSPDVRRAFYELAASLLLRPSPPRATAAEASAEAASVFFAAGRMLPFFERDAPRHAPALRARMEALAGAIDEARRERLSAHMSADGPREKNPPDPLEKFLSDLSDPVNRAERLGMRLLAVAEAARRKLWDRARKLAAEIPEQEARREATTIIASYQIKYLTDTYADDDDENDFELAVAFAREADVPPAVRARGLAQAAEMALRKGRRERASELLEEGVVYALRADKGTAQRLDALAVLNSLAARLDKGRAWELLAEVVRSANAFDAAAAEAPPLSPEAEVLASLKADSGDPLEKIFEPFRTDELFATMARSDVARTLTEARALEDIETRAAALVAAARAVLERAAAKTPGVASR